MAVRQIEPIDRAELRATIQKWIDAHTDVDDTDGVGLLEDVLWEINAQPTLTPPNEWVSVEERLPKAEKEVRLFCITPNGYKYQCQGFYVPPGMLRDDSDYSWDWECCDEYDEDSDDYFVNPGWYESCHNWDEYSAFRVADKVTHWMPLPAPPGEDNNVPTNKPLTLEFDVVDTTTGKYPDWERITIEEPWANRLVDCDMDGIAIREDGSLILLDECGNCVSCPPDRFEIRRPPEGEEDNNG